ncbi:pisatin demethylase [Xylariaceae sp. FL0016]|nr:pisatin demethylase [Xylariaceae sp. FL0016]
MMTASIMQVEQVSALFIGLGASALIYIVYSYVMTWYRLRKIPGPLLAHFSYLWLAKVSMGGRQYYIYRGLCEKYGPLVRVGPNEITTDDPEIIRKMSAARSQYGKGEWYIGARFNPYSDSMFTNTNVHEHDKMKSKTASAYGGRDTPALEIGVDQQVSSLVQIIRDKYLWSQDKRDAPLLDIAKLMSFFTMDVITKAAFGEEFGYLREQSDLFNFLRGVRENWPKLAASIEVPLIRNTLYSRTYLNFLGPRTTDKEGMGSLMGVAEKLVDRRFKQGLKGEEDMLASFIRHGLSRTNCKVEGLFMVIAGSDTSAGAMRTTLLYIMTCPRVYQKLKAEIARVLKEGRVSSPISYEEARNIPFLQAVVYEGLRMRPPAPGLYPKSVPPEGDVIHGKFIPGGTVIGMNTSSLLASKSLFGSDADIFRPERFMEVDQATRTEMERLVELIFGYGRFMCAGKPVAFMELNKMYFELLRAFDLQLANPMKPWDSQSWSVFVEENFWVKVTESRL